MFSARDDNGTVHISGKLQPNPRTLDYFCSQCNSRVSYVEETTRRIKVGSREVPVREHFRHPAGEGNHPLLQYSWQAHEIMNLLLDNYQSQPWIDVQTDVVFDDGHGLEFAVNMLLREQRFRINESDYTIEGNDSKQTAVVIASGSFNSADLGAQLRYLSASGIHALVVLSAQGDNNPSGKYYKESTREGSPANTRQIRGNEKDLLDLFGGLVYIDHDSGEMAVAKFRNYREPLGPDPSNDCRYCQEDPLYPSSSPEYCRPHWFSWGEPRSRGQTHRELETEKIPDEVFRNKRFALVYGTTNTARGTRILIAKPTELPRYYESVAEQLRSLEDAIKSGDEDTIDDLARDRIPIMLEGNNVPLGVGPDAYFRQLLEKVEK
ncbi:TPA: hypothetical protein HA246_00415 [Candidatus Woesearchaeota archaeon]|nr:hypothetical protein [Candidatus Woesearchaeota archaeon]